MAGKEGSGHAPRMASRGAGQACQDLSSDDSAGIHLKDPKRLTAAALAVAVLEELVARARRQRDPGMWHAQ